MKENNLVGKNVVYLGVNSEEIDKVISVLDSAKIQYNGDYKDGQDIFCHEEAITVPSTLYGEHPEKKISPEHEKQLIEDIYNELNNRNIEYGIFDTEYIYEVEQKHLKKYMTRE